MSKTSPVAAATASAPSTELAERTKSDQKAPVKPTDKRPRECKERYTD